MIQRQEHTGFMHVQQYGLAEWLAEVEELMNQGYKFDFESNENYPQSIGHMFTAVLVPKEDKKKVAALLRPPEQPVLVPSDSSVEDPVDTPSSDTDVNQELQALQAIVEEGKAKQGRKPKVK